MKNPIVILGVIFCAGCTAAVVDGESAESALVVEVADSAHGLRGSLVVDGELVAVESRTADGIRAISVTGAEGTRFAEWNVTVADHEIVGAFGGQEFGRVETAESDQDPGYWQPVAESRVGEVIAAVSAAAEPLVGDPDLEAVASDLENLSWMSDYLERLAGAPDDVLASSCTNFRQFSALEAGGARTSTTCELWWWAATNRCGGALPNGSTLTAYVRVYNGSKTGSVFGYDASYSDGRRAWANVNKGQVVSRGTATVTVTKIARHWDNRGYAVWSSYESAACPRR